MIRKKSTIPITGLERGVATSESECIESSIKSEYTGWDTEAIIDQAANIIRMLRENGETLGVVEGRTAGPTLTSLLEASAAFPDRTVSHVTRLKQLSLQADVDMLVKLGMAYRGIAEHMAIGARKITTLDERLTTWGVALIGTDGPTQQDGKPVRLLYIGISSPDEAKAWGPFEFSGTREEVRKAAVVEALVRLHNTMSTRQGDKVSRVAKGIRRAYEELIGS